MTDHLIRLDTYDNYPTNVPRESNANFNVSIGLAYFKEGMASVQRVSDEQASAPTEYSVEARLSRPVDRLDRISAYPPNRMAVRDEDRRLLVDYPPELEGLLDAVGALADSHEKPRSLTLLGDKMISKALGELIRIKTSRSWFITRFTLQVINYSDKKFEPKSTSLESQLWRLTS